MVVYEIEGIHIEKRVFMVPGENSTIIEYEISGSIPRAGVCALELRPLIAFRDYRSTTHRNDALNPSVRSEGGVRDSGSIPGPA